MLVTHGITRKISTVNMPAVRDELAATLEQTLHLQQRLMDKVRDEEVDVADLVAQVSVLGRLDDQRDRLIGKLRRTASAGMRPARTSQPVREILLETLADFRWPQMPGSSRSTAGQAPAATRQPRVRAAAPRRAECLGPGTGRPCGLHRSRTETGRVREPSLDHPFRLGHGAPHRGHAAD